MFIVYITKLLWIIPLIIVIIFQIYFKDLTYKNYYILFISYYLNISATIFITLITELFLKRLIKESNAELYGEYILLKGIENGLGSFIFNIKNKFNYKYIAFVLFLFSLSLLEKLTPFLINEISINKPLNFNIDIKTLNMDMLFNTSCKGDRLQQQDGPPESYMNIISYLYKVDQQNKNQIEALDMFLNDSIIWTQIDDNNIILFGNPNNELYKYPNYNGLKNYEIQNINGLKIEVICNISTNSSIPGGYNSSARTGFQQYGDGDDIYIKDNQEMNLQEFNIIINNIRVTVVCDPNGIPIIINDNNSENIKKDTISMIWCDNGACYLQPYVYVQQCGINLNFIKGNLEANNILNNKWIYKINNITKIKRLLDIENKINSSLSFNRLPEMMISLYRKGPYSGNMNEIFKLGEKINMIKDLQNTILIYISHLISANKTTSYQMTECDIFNDNKITTPNLIDENNLYVELNYTINVLKINNFVWVFSILVSLTTIILFILIKNNNSENDKVIDNKFRNLRGHIKIIIYKLLNIEDNTLLEWEHEKMKNIKIRLSIDNIPYKYFIKKNEENEEFNINK